MEQIGGASYPNRSHSPGAQVFEQLRQLSLLASNQSKLSARETASSCDDPEATHPACLSIEESTRSNPFCVFCKNNKASRSVYRSHVIKDNRGLVVCPTLRKYNCPYCNNGGGDLAHTVNFCPKKRADFLNSFLKNK